MHINNSRSLERSLKNTGFAICCYGATDRCLATARTRPSEFSIPASSLLPYIPFQAPRCCCLLFSAFVRRIVFCECELAYCVGPWINNALGGLRPVRLFAEFFVFSLKNPGLNSLQFRKTICMCRLKGTITRSLRVFSQRALCVSSPTVVIFPAVVGSV